MKKQPSVEELNQAMAAFLMCFGAGLPDPLKASIRERALDLADQIARGGEPTVARLTKGFADALCAVHPPANH